MDTLIDTVARATADPTERLLLATLIVAEVRRASLTETVSTATTTFRRFADKENVT